MKPRERVIRALERKEVDRVPLDLGGSLCSTIKLPAYQRLADHLGFQVEPDIIIKRSKLVRVDEKILQYFGIDIRCLYVKTPEVSARELPDGTLVNQWGVPYRKPVDSEENYSICGHPLQEADFEDLERYPWPQVGTAPSPPALIQQAKDLHENTDYAVMLNIDQPEVFDICWYLRGFENFLVDLIANPKFAHGLLRIVTDIQKQRFAAVLGDFGRYIDIVYLADDLSSQQAPYISPELYRSHVKAYHRELIELIRTHSDAKIFFHCCGNVRDLLDDLIDIGVDVINPVQVSARDMDPVQLKRDFGERIAFWGGVDTQHVLPYGSVDEVKEAVKHCIEALAPGGGYILAPVHNIQQDVPAENIVAMYKTALQWGRPPS